MNASKREAVLAALAGKRADVLAIERELRARLERQPDERGRAALKALIALRKAIERAHDALINHRPAG